MSLPAHRTQTMRGLAAGTRLGRYVVVRRLASGGMAELYLGRLDGPQRFVKPVALKLMHSHLLDDAGFVDMFLREARIAAALEHPGIVQILDVGHAHGEHFLALEYVHGRDLRQILRDGGGASLDLGCALRIVTDVAAALHYAHRLRDNHGRPLQIVHRDVSPSNILVSYSGTVKLADFGVARMAEHTQATATGSLKGKLGYMSPEQCMQASIDARSDVFSLGVVLYEATTGRRAFVGEPIAVMNQVIDGEWTPPDHIVPDYPTQLAAIVARALAPDPAERYASAAALAEDLASFAATAGIDMRNESLEQALAQRYGAPDVPDLHVPEILHTPTDPDTVASVTVPRLPMPEPAPGRSASATTIGLSLVGVLAVGAVAGWTMASRSSAAVDGERRPASPSVDDAAVAAEVAAPEADPAADGPEPALDDDAASEAGSPSEVPSVVPAPPPVAAPAPAKSTRSKSRTTRRRTRTNAKTSAAPAPDPRDAMLPRSAR